MWEIKIPSIPVETTKSAVIPICTIWFKETTRVTFKSSEAAFFQLLDE